jgi:hypothetical protein
MPVATTVATPFATLFSPIPGFGKRTSGNVDSFPFGCSSVALALQKEDSHVALLWTFFGSLAYRPFPAFRPASRRRNEPPAGDIAFAARRLGVAHRA